MVIDNTKKQKTPEEKQEEKQMAKIKNIYHRKDGRWEYTTMKNGNKTYLIASTKEKLIEKIKEYKNQERTTRQVIRYETIESWSSKWVKLYKMDVGETTRKRYEGLIKNYIVPFFGQTRIDKITPMKVQEFVNSIKAERNREYAYITIKQIFRQAFINKKIKENIAEQIVKPRNKTKPNKTALNLQEQIDFMNQLTKYDRDVQSFMIFSIILGSRRGETIKFKLEDINKEKNTIHIKGTKTYGADRRIKISNEMIQYLEGNNRKNNEIYFQRNADYYSKRCLEIYQLCGIENKTLHDLRHTCSTNLFYLGVPDKQRQQVLGHQSIIMTNDIYTNLQEDLDKEGIIKLYNNLYYKF